MNNKQTTPFNQMLQEHPTVEQYNELNAELQDTKSALEGYKMVWSAAEKVMALQSDELVKALAEIEHMKKLVEHWKFEQECAAANHMKALEKLANKN